MPPNRSRTQRWREQLELIKARRGGLEISLGNDGGDEAPDLVWRVRLLDLGGDHILVEVPGAAGSPLPIEAGTQIIVAMQVGQNRWMFGSRVLEVIDAPETPGGLAMRLALPDRVERCRRRSFYRVSTAHVNLPAVECWPVLDPSTIVAAELANKAEIKGGGSSEEAPMLLPEVGPSFPAKLLNISGGGVGLMIDAEDAGGFDQSRILWMRIDLRPRIPAPIGVTARVAHSHRDSEQNLIVGLAFEFQFNPPHRAFVVDQICRYVEAHRTSYPEAA